MTVLIFICEKWVTYGCEKMLCNTVVLNLNKYYTENDVYFNPLRTSVSKYNSKSVQYYPSPSAKFYYLLGV